ncbi:MAG: ATP-grasp domain-containing protein [Desulfobacterium sp.]|jgi:ribosomal protein S6--L-glutamate ligase|nr:ATP-grasp domain-containing protein [Desulfobacterium sp.]
MESSHSLQQSPILPLPGEQECVPFIALGARLGRSKLVTTLGFKPNFWDYTDREMDLIRRAPTIYWPTAFYAGLFSAMGKKTFPSVDNYAFALDKIKQTAMFNLLNIPHPRTRLFYGKNQKQTITDFFSFPFIAKIPRGSSRGKGVFLIKTPKDLNTYLEIPGPAYIQEYLPADRDMRVIVIGRQIVLAFWRRAKENEFRTNISQGGKIDFSDLSCQAMELALDTARRCNWDDVGLDIMEYQGKPMVIEANMKYGTKGFKAAGIDYIRMVERLIVTGKI